MTLADRQDSNGKWLKNYSVGGKSQKTRAGQLWLNLESRTTNQSHKDSCYDGAINGFADFQEFAGWCQSQEGYTNKEDNGYHWQLDKDILSPDLKVYSPDTCVFVPNKLNSLLMDQPSKSGLPKGVRHYPNNSSKYVAHGRDTSGVKRHIGVFNSPEEAHQAWYSHKQEVIRMILKEYKLASRIVEALKTGWDL